MRQIEPSFFDLNPESIIKIFDVINDCIKFNPDNDKKAGGLHKLLTGNEYSLEEKFFIAHFLPEFLKSNTKNYFSKRNQGIEDLGDLEAFEDLDKYRDGIGEILKACKVNFNVLKRRYNKSLGAAEEDYTYVIEEEIKTWKRLPLNKEKKHLFITFIYKQLELIFKKDQIDAIIHNSFNTHNTNDSISLLYFEYENSADVHKAFYNIYKEYKKRETEIYNLSITSEVRKLKTKNQKILSDGKTGRHMFIRGLDKNEYKRATNKSNFAKLMFLAFPQIRENYQHAKSKENKSIDGFLETLTKNIK